MQTKPQLKTFDYLMTVHLKSFFLPTLLFLAAITPTHAGWFDRQCEKSMPTTQWTNCLGEGEFLGSQYSGRWENGKPHGVGTIFHKDNTSFEGSFFAGAPIYSCEGISRNRKFTIEKRREGSNREVTSIASAQIPRILERKITSAKLDTQNDTLNITFELLELQELLKGPSIKEIEYRQYEQAIGGAVFLGAITAGIYPLLNPKETVRDFAGCEELRAIKYVPDQPMQKKSGNRFWGRPIASTSGTRVLSLKIGDVSDPRVHANFFSNGSGFEIAAMPLAWAPNIKELLFKEGIEKPLVLTIECIDCAADNSTNLLVEKLPAEFIDMRTAINIDLSAENERLVGRVKKEAEFARTERLRLAKEEEFRKAAEERKRIETERIAREGDGSPDDLNCKKFGFQPQALGYGDCRLKLELARKQFEVQQKEFEERQRQFQAQLDSYNQEVERQKGLAMMKFGLNLMAGTSPYASQNFANAARETFGPPPSPPQPLGIRTQNIVMPNGRLITCTSTQNLTNCF
jgi:hypothetical protein